MRPFSCAAYRYSAICFTMLRDSSKGSFFFSSRRRHTRCLSDWSSDVCSSDLHALPHIGLERPAPREDQVKAPARPGERLRRVEHDAVARSEERRVGKEASGRDLAVRGIEIEVNEAFLMRRLQIFRHLLYDAARLLQRQLFFFKQKTAYEMPK